MPTFLEHSSISSWSCLVNPSPLSHLFVAPSCLKEDKVEVVSQPQDERAGTNQEEVESEQPGNNLLEQRDCLTEVQDLGFKQAQIPDALNGGSHAHSPSNQGVCGYDIVKSGAPLTVHPFLRFKDPLR